MNPFLDLEKKIELNIKKRIIVNNKTSINDIKHKVLEYCGNNYTQDFKFSINDEDITSLGQLKILRILEYYNSDSVIIIPIEDSDYFGSLYNNYNNLVSNSPIKTSSINLKIGNIDELGESIKKTDETPKRVKNYTTKQRNYREKFRGTYSSDFSKKPTGNFNNESQNEQNSNANQDIYNSRNQKINSENIFTRNHSPTRNILDNTILPSNTINTNEIWKQNSTEISNQIIKSNHSNNILRDNIVELEKLNCQLESENKYLRNKAGELEKKLSDISKDHYEIIHIPKDKVSGKENRHEGPINNHNFDKKCLLLTEQLKYLKGKYFEKELKLAKILKEKEILIKKLNNSKFSKAELSMSTNTNVIKLNNSKIDLLQPCISERFFILAKYEILSFDEKNKNKILELKLQINKLNKEKKNLQIQLNKNTNKRKFFTESTLTNSTFERASERVKMFLPEVINSIELSSFRRNLQFQNEKYWGKNLRPVNLNNFEILGKYISFSGSYYHSQNIPKITTMYFESKTYFKIGRNKQLTSNVKTAFPNKKSHYISNIDIKSQLRNNHKEDKISKLINIIGENDQLNRISALENEKVEKKDNQLKKILPKNGLIDITNSMNKYCHVINHSSTIVGKNVTTYYQSKINHGMRHFVRESFSIRSSTNSNNVNFMQNNDLNSKINKNRILTETEGGNFKRKGIELKNKSTLEEAFRDLLGNKSIATIKNKDILNNSIEEEVSKIEINHKIMKYIDKNSILKLKKQNEEIIEIEDGVSFLFRVYDKKSLLRFDIENRKFKVIDFADYGDFEHNFNSQGSIYLNTISGLFIITGKNIDMFYYFNYKSKSMVKLSSLNDNHTFGSLIYYEKDNKLLCLSGWHNKKVEIYSNDEIICRYINSNDQLKNNNSSIIKNTWTYLPEMKLERSECPYLIINEIFLYAFFGYNCPRSTYISTIERLNLDTSKCWEDVKIINENHLSTHIKSHSCLRINGNDVLFLGGYDGFNECPIESFFVFKIKENILTPCNRNYPEIALNHIYNFQNDSAMVPYIDTKGRLSYACFDENDRVHSINMELLNYDIFKFD